MENIKETTAGADKKKHKPAWKKWLYRIIIAGILVLIGYVAIGYYFTYSSGFRAGKIIKFSEKGFVFKTWEGQIYLGTITPDEAGISSKYWDFSVDRGDEKVIKAIEDAMTQKHEVRLHYKEKMVQFNWRGDTRYFVDSIDLVK